MTDERWGDDEIDALLAAARDVPPAPASARARVADRLAATIAPPPSAPMTPASSGATAGGAVSGGAVSGGAVSGGAVLSTAGWAVVVGLALAVGIGIGWLRPGAEAPMTGPSGAAASARVPSGPLSGTAPSGTAPSGTAPSGSAPDRTDSSGDEPSATEASDVLSGASAGEQRPGSLRPPPRLDRALAAERALLQAAREALVARHLDAAIEALATHQSRFGEGRLVEEREVLWIRALLAADRADDARMRAAAFVTAHPESVFRPAVEALVRR